MSTNEKKNKSSELAGASALIAGIQKHLNGASVIVNGTTYASADLVKALQSTIDAVNATIANKAAWQAAVKDETAQLALSRAFTNALRKAIYTMFTDVAVLADFGLTPHKKPVITPAERMVMTAKAKATRAARHTMGSKQKAAIVGTVPAPATTASTPASPPPAAPAGSGAPVAPAPSPAPAAPATTAPAPASPATPPVTPA